MISKVETLLTYVPFSQILLDERSYRFRLPDLDRENNLKNSLIRSGQTHPIIIEEVNPESFVILDGHARCQAVARIRETGTWDKVLAHILNPHQISIFDRLRLLMERNIDGENPYGMCEKGAFFKYFVERGLTLQEISREAGLTVHAVEDFIELAGAPTDLTTLLNESNLETIYAAMLCRRYQNWMQTPYAEFAPSVTKTILNHAKGNRVTMKSWRFLLDFYWESGRPFLVKPF